MSRRWANVLGILLGVIFAAMMVQWVNHRSGVRHTRGEILSECDGSIREIVVQYVSGADGARQVLAAFLRQLPKTVKIHLVCPDSAAYDEWSAGGETDARRAQPISVGHDMTAWSRDRWVALKQPGANATFLFHPRAEAGADAWPQRAGDQQIASDLARCLAPAVRDLPSRLLFDGGDFLTDAQTVFVTPAVCQRNNVGTSADMQRLSDELQAAFSKNIVFLSDAPPHHVGMYMALLPGKVALVGDPSLALQFVPSLATSVLASPDFSPDTQHQFDAVAETARRQGYHVVRIPTAVDRDGKTYLTYVNGLIDHEGANSVVYMPTFAGVEALNAAAEQVWRDRGFEVRRVDCTGVYRSFGTLHCLVNVLKRT